MSGDEVRVEPADLLRRRAQLRHGAGGFAAAAGGAVWVEFVSPQRVGGRQERRDVEEFLASGNAEAVRLAAETNAAARTYSTVDDRASEALNSFRRSRFRTILFRSPRRCRLPCPRSTAAVDARNPRRYRRLYGSQGGGADIHSGDSAPMSTYAGDVRDRESLRDQSDASRSTESTGRARRRRQRARPCASTRAG